MRELTIISGKGGTGKTSLTASFAALADGAILVDCDVDAPDMHLVLEPDIQRRESFTGGKKARLDPDRCGACGRCLEVCRFDAITANGDGEPPTLSSLACEGCSVCATLCPTQAIEMIPSIAGEWFISTTRRGPMVHACLGPAQDNSGKLVALLRREARTLARAEGRELILSDGPPGIGCPVIASLGGTSLVLIVIEPTVFGLHDFERALELTRRFKIPTVACLNKADLHPGLAERVAARTAELGVDLLGRVPYDPAVVRAQLQRRSVVETGDGPAATAIRDLFDKLLARLEDAPLPTAASRLPMSQT
ncbi:MAG: 4Fe-4S binding protein [Phycisphaerae bacterium]